MENTKILIVEDDAVSRGLLRKALENLGHTNIISTASGFEAIDIARLEKIDLVMMDIGLQNSMDGINTSKIIGDKCKVVFVSSISQDDFAQRIGNLTNVAFLAKPFTTESVKAILESALN